MFWTIAWCASQIMVISTGGVTTSLGFMPDRKLVCYDNKYEVYPSSAAMIFFRNTLSKNQKASAKMFELRELRATDDTVLEYVDPIEPFVIQTP